MSPGLSSASRPSTSSPNGASFPETASGEAYERLARTAARALNAAAVLICSGEPGGLGIRGCHAPSKLGPDGAALVRALGQGVVADGAPLLVADARAESLVPARALLERHGLVSCAAVPVGRPGARALGCVVVLDDAPRSWGGETGEALRDVAGTALGLVEADAAEPGNQGAADQNDLGAAYLAHLFAASPEAIAFGGNDDRVIHVNPQFTRLFGFTQEEAVGRPIDELIVPPDRRAEAEGLTARLGGGEPVAVEVVRMRKDGSTVHVSVLAAPVCVEGRKVGVCAIYRDITERRRAREALQKSEERFRSLTENAADVVTILTTGGTIDYATPSLERVLGYAVGELVGTNAFALIHPDDAADTIARFSAVMRGQPCEGPLECRVRHKDGSWRSFETRASNLLHDAAVAGVVVNSRDVTDERSAERNQRRLNAFLEATPDFVATFDPYGRALSVNRAFRQVAGLDADDDLTAVTLADFFPQRVTEVILREGIPTATREGLWSGETSLVTRDGEEIPISQVILAHKAKNGAIEFLSTLARNITERKQAEAALQKREELFRSLIENASDIITILDPDGKVLFLSPAAERVLGYDPEEMLGVSVFELVHPDDSAAAVSALRRGIRGEIDLSVPREFRFRHRDGSWRVLESVGEDLIEEPAVGGVVINSRDVTERHAAETALKESQQQLIQSQKMEAVGRLAGGVAHDFNNLLTAIKGFTELLLLDFDDRDPRRSFASEIAGAANRAAGLTRQLLAFSRKQVLQPKVIELNAVVADMENMLQRLLGEDLDLVIDLQPGLGRLRADPGQIEQVVLNLAVNARDAMPKGGRLTVHTENLTLEAERIPKNAEVQPGPFVLLSVSDTGAGMPREVQERIFEPFFTTKEQGKGTGLGLSTVYGIVKQSGGWLEVDSAPGEGTTFRVYLPRVEDQVEGGPAPRRPQGSVRGSETVLLVEDEIAVRVLVRRVLDRNGYRVLEAESGPDALALLDKHPGPVDLLLTDVVMPGMSGRELADQLCARFPGLRVLYMSGYTDEAIVHHGVLDSGVTLLEKPFTPDILLRKLRDVIETAGAR